jgi:hypothetical protein
MITDNDAASTAAVLNDRREIIVAAMSRYIARPEHGTPTAERTMVATILFDAMMASINSAEPLSIGSPSDISRQSIARFGDGLIPILKDIIGPDLPATSLSRVSDAYWRMISGVEVAAE